MAERLMVRMPPASGLAAPDFTSWGGAVSAEKSDCRAVSVMPLGFSRPRAGSPWRGADASGALREVLATRERREARHCGVELQFYRSSRPMPLFADNNFGFAMDLIGLRQPFRELVTV